MSRLFFNSNFFVPKNHFEKSKNRFWKNIEKIFSIIKINKIDFFKKSILLIFVMIFHFFEKIFFRFFKIIFWNEIFELEKNLGHQYRCKKLSGIDLWCFQNVSSTPSGQRCAIKLWYILRYFCVLNVASDAVLESISWISCTSTRRSREVYLS